MAKTKRKSLESGITNKTDSSSSDGKKKETKGRRRVEIKKVECKSKRHVTFSKRKTGLFKKAAELSVLTGAETAMIVVSGNGKVFCFGHPACDAVFNRYLGQPQPEDHHGQNDVALNSYINKQVEGYVEATRQLEAEKQKLLQPGGGEGGGFCDWWWDKPVDSMINSLEELEEYKAALQKLKYNVEVRTNQMIRETHSNYYSSTNERMIRETDPNYYSTNQMIWDQTTPNYYTSLMDYGVVLD